MSHRSAKPWGNYPELNADGLRALDAIERAIHAPQDQSYPRPEPPLPSAHQTASTALQPFEHLPSLSDENIANMLRYLLAMVDAFEDHYADPIRRLRNKHHEQEQQDLKEEQHDWINDASDDIEF